MIPEAPSQIPSNMDGHTILFKRILAIVAVTLVLSALGYAGYKAYFKRANDHSLSAEERARVLELLGKMPPAGDPLSTKEKTAVLKSLSKTPAGGTSLSEEEKQKVLDSLKLPQ